MGWGRSWQGDNEYPNTKDDSDDDGDDKDEKDKKEDADEDDDVNDDVTGASTLEWVGDTADKVLGAQLDQIVSPVRQ